MVAVDVLRIAPVVHAMVGGGVENPLERPQLSDEAGVDPELVEGVDRGDGQEHGGREAKEGEREVEHPGHRPLEDALAQRHREVHVLALVVDDVGRPARVDLVARAVEPVVEEVHPQPAGEPGQGGRQGMVVSRKRS